MYNENFCIRRIKELMKKNDDTLYRLSKRSGVSLSTLASMFEKNTDPRVETIEKICAACDITVSQFFDSLLQFDSKSAATFHIVQFAESGTPANGAFLFQFFRA